MKYFMTNDKKQEPKVLKKQPRIRTLLLQIKE